MAHCYTFAIPLFLSHSLGGCCHIFMKLLAQSPLWKALRGVTNWIPRARTNTLQPAAVCSEQLRQRRAEKIHVCVWQQWKTGAFCVREINRLLLAKYSTPLCCRCSYSLRLITFLNCVTPSILSDPSIEYWLSTRFYKNHHCLAFLHCLLRSFQINTHWLNAWSLIIHDTSLN